MMMPIKFAEIAWPKTGRFWLANARVPVCLLADTAAFAARIDAEGVVEADLLVDGGKLARVATPDLGGAMVSNASILAAVRRGRL